MTGENEDKASGNSFEQLFNLVGVCATIFF